MKIFSLKNIYLFIIILINLFLSIYKLGERSLSGDEARTAIKSIWIMKGLWQILQFNFNKETFLSFYGIFTSTHPPLALIFPLPFLLFGVNEITLRLASVVTGLMIVIFTYFVIKKEFSFKLSFVMGLFFACSSVIIGWSRWVDNQIMEILLAGMLTYSIYLFVKFRNRQYFYWLMFIYTLCLFTMFIFLIVLPLVLFYSIKFWKKLTVKERIKGLLIPLLTAGLFYVCWLLISLFYLKEALGLRYLLFYRMQIFGTFWGTLKYFIKNFLLDPNIIIWWPFILLGLKNLQRNKLVQISSLYCLFYLIFFFLFKLEKSYLFHIYLPFIFIGINGLKFIKKKIIMFIFSFLAIGNFLLMIYLLGGGNYFTNLVWSFSYGKTSLKEIGLVVRQCLAKEDKYITMDDYSTTSYYFNRKYPAESDLKGRQYAIENIDNLGVKAVVVSDLFLEKNKDIQSFLETHAVSYKKFFDGHQLYLFKKCDLKKIYDKEDFFDERYGNFLQIIDFKL